MLIDQKAAEDNLANLVRNGGAMPTKLEDFLELANNAGLSHAIAFPNERREMVNIFTSNRLVNGKKLDLKPSLPFEEIANRPLYNYCSQQQDIPRTWDRILDTLSKLNTQHLLPDLSFMSGFKHHGDSIAPKVADRDNNSAVV